MASSLVQGPTKGMEAAPGGAGSSLTRFGKNLATGAVSTIGAGAIQALESLTGLRLDPAPAYLFYIELGGLIVAEFTECGGLDLERDVTEWVEGGVNDRVHKFAGRSKYGNITLKRGMTASRVLWNWYHDGLHNTKVKKLNFSIIVGAPMQSPLSILGNISERAIQPHANEASNIASQVMESIDWGFTKLKHWDVEDAFPIKWVGPTLDTSSTNTAIEEIVIAHHGLNLTLDVMTPYNVAAMATNLVGGAVGAIPGA